MLWFCVMLVGSGIIVQANPISNKLDVDVQSNFDDTANDVSISHDPKKSLDAYCSSDTFIDDLAENSSSSADDFSLWRRDIEYCPSSSTVSKPPEPHRRPTLTEPSDEPCPDTKGRKRLLPVTCAGPEVWRRKPQDLTWVGNCEAGEMVFLFVHNVNPN